MEDWVEKAIAQTGVVAAANFAGETLPPITPNRNAIGVEIAVMIETNRT